jgi:hypothetical protein
VVARGVHFALSDIDERRLLDCSEQDRVQLISEDIEERHFASATEWLCQTDKAWDAIHRAFNNGNLDCDYKSPLHGVILGGKALYFGDNYIISYKNNEQVKEIAPALAEMDECSFKVLYFAIDEKKYGFPLTQEDYEYSWNWLSGLKEFYNRAAKFERPVIFTTDQ